MNLLCLDTSSSTVVLGATKRGQRPEVLKVHSEDHAALLLSSVDRLLASSGLTLETLEGYGIVLGPGSFTGLRIGLATLKGFDLVFHKPAVGLCALEALALGAPKDDLTLAPMIHARKGMAYCAVYRWSGTELHPLAAPAEVSLADFLQKYPDACVFGSAVERQPDFFKYARVLPSEFNAPRGDVLCDMALRKFDGGDFLDLASAEPDYLVPNVASQV